MTTESQDQRPTSYRVDLAMVKGDALLLGLLLADLVYGSLSLPKMPARVPIHWGLDGQPNDWGAPWINALLPPLIGLTLYLSFLLLPVIDPRRRNYPLFLDTLRFFRWLMVLLMIGLHVVVVRASLGAHMHVDFVVRLGIGLLFAALGNRFGTLRQNFFFGIRVPWTISSEEVWNRTHRMAGPIWVAGGFLLAVSAFLPPGPGYVVLGIVVAVLAVVPILYSYRLYQKIAAD